METVIAIIVSVVLSGILDCYLLKSSGVGNRDYENLMNFSRSNKNLKSYQNVFEDIYKRISELERQISDMPQDSGMQSYDYSELRREFELLKNMVCNTQNVSDNSDSNNEYIVGILKKLTERILVLENKMTDYTAVPSSSDTGSLDRKVNVLESEIESLKTVVNNLNSYSGSDSSGEMLNRLISAEYEIEKLKNLLNRQNLEYPKTENKNPYQTPNGKGSEVSRTFSKSQAFTSARTVIPDKNYVKSLLENLISLRGVLDIPEYDHCESGLKKILNSGDFDDGEEIMIPVHNLIEKYIYGSDTKVSVDNWKILEKYIRDAGYTEVPVKAGDDVAPFKSYFSRPIPASGGVPDTIKHIQLQPYVLTYEDCGEKETLKLCGKCTYYK